MATVGIKGLIQCLMKFCLRMFVGLSIFRMSDMWIIKRILKNHSKWVLLSHCNHWNTGLLIVILQGPRRVAGAGQALSRSSSAFTVSRHIQRYFKLNLLIYLLFVQCNVWHWRGNKIIVCQCIRPPSVFVRLIYLRTTCSINIDINIYIWLYWC